MEGQQKFYTFMMNCAKEDVKDRMSMLLEEAFTKQKDGTFQKSDVDDMMKACTSLVKEDKQEEVMNIMKQFQSQMK